jgi:hypothetical protein
LHEPRLALYCSGRSADAFLFTGQESSVESIQGADGSTKVQRQVRKSVRQIIPLAVVLIGLLLATPPNIYTARQIIDPGEDLLDTSWVISLPAQLMKGGVSGRDFIFTYGPLYQLIHGLGAFLPPGGLASILRFQWALEAWLVMLGAWFVLRLTGAPLAWRTVAYLLWACFWSQWFLTTGTGLKPLAGLFWLAACGHVLATTSSASKSRANTLKAVLTWALATPVLLLYAFDLGVMTFFGLMLSAPALWLCLRSSHNENARAARRLILRCFAAAFIALIALFALLSLSKGWNRYLLDSWQLASGYAITLSFHIGRKSLLTLALTFCLTLMMMLATWLYLRRAYSQQGTLAGTGKTLALFTMTSFCMFWLRSPLTRSDNSHVLVGLLPFLFVASCFLPCYLRARGLSVSWLALALAFPLLSVPYVVTGMPTPKTSIPPVHRWTLARLEAITHLELKGAQLLIEHQSISEASAVAQSLPGEALYVWPYETMVNSLSGKTIVDRTLQSYAATTPGLERATINRLESMPGVPVMLFSDSIAVDEVENLTRTPEIFRFLLERYEMTGTRGKEFLVLHRSDERKAEWREQGLSAAVAGSLTPGVGASSLKVNLSLEQGDECRASDLLSMRLRIARTRMFGIRKPGELFITFFLSNGEQRTQKLVVPPDGEPHSILASACTLRDPLFASIFAPHKSWRSSERLVALELRWARSDLLSAVPREVKLEGVSILKRAGAETIETSLTEQEQPFFWNRLYEGAASPAGH